jgi:DNA-binding response OmpR family regulator
MSASDGEVTAVRILIVDGDGEYAEWLAERLARHGHQVDRVATGRAGLAQHQEFDLVLLALALPDLDGIQVCHELRSISDVPIVALTEHDDELDRVLCLRSGADDCVTKASEPDELAARVLAVARRAGPRGAAGPRLRRGRLAVDPAAREVRLDDELIRTTRKEFDLLHLLLSEPDRTFTRELLMAQVWDTHSDQYWVAPDYRTVDTHVSGLRTKLGARSWILSVRGVGFRIGAG